MSKYVYGIDLGTTNSRIARLNDNGIPEILQNSEGANYTPSVVFFDGNKIVVGQVAKFNNVIEPENTVSFVKTLMGKTDCAINYNGRDITPSEISSYILKKVALDASEQTGDEVKDVIITVPAFFGAAERDATVFAGELAGLNVLSTINDTIAAAIYYGFTNPTEEKNILVYILGGGMFEVTVIKVESGKIEAVCSDGCPDLGGKDWDKKIENYLLKEFRELSGFNGELDPADLHDLALKAENTKRELTHSDSTIITMTFSGYRARVELTREKFDELTSALLEHTITLTDSAIENAKKKGVDVDQILLVGGSTRMPQVSTILKSKYGIDPLFFEPDEAVAKGVVIYATDVYIKRTG